MRITLIILCCDISFVCLFVFVIFLFVRVCSSSVFLLLFFDQKRLKTQLDIGQESQMGQLQAPSVKSAFISSRALKMFFAILWELVTEEDLLEETWKTSLSSPAIM